MNLVSLSEIAWRAFRSMIFLIAASRFWNFSLSARRFSDRVAELRHQRGPGPG